jgi:16S rRNA (guanine1207-N2)-methyltransferase
MSMPNLAPSQQPHTPLTLHRHHLDPSFVQFVQFVAVARLTRVRTPAIMPGMAETKPSLPYTQTRELRVTLGGEQVRVVTKPGFASWDRITAASELLAEHARLMPDAYVALLGCGHGALGVVLARRASRGRVVLHDPSVVALAMAERTLAANDVRGAELREGITLLPELTEVLDAVLIETPQSRPLARRWLLEAYAALRPGGELLLAGANDQGIQSIIADAAALFGGATAIGYGGRARIGRAVKGEPPPLPSWAGEPGVAPGTWAELTAMVGGEQFHLRSLPGIFSYARLDDGTRLLLEAMPEARGADVLDIGCGYGVIGIVAARRGAASVDLLDASALAVAAARENLRLHHIAGANVMPSDALAAVQERSYDLILSNPPFHAGKRVDYDIARTFIEQGRRRLRAGGQMALVANRFIRYDEIMRPLFGKTEIVARTQGYQVIVGRVGVGR